MRTTASRSSGEASATPSPGGAGPGARALPASSSSDAMAAGRGSGRTPGPARRGRVRVVPGDRQVDRGDQVLAGAVVVDAIADGQALAPWAMRAMTVPVVDARGSPGRPAAESRTPSIAVVSSGRACRAISARSSASDAASRLMSRNIHARALQAAWNVDVANHRAGLCIDPAVLFSRSMPAAGSLVHAEPIPDPDRYRHRRQLGHRARRRHPDRRARRRRDPDLQRQPRRGGGDGRGHRGARRHRRRPRARRRRQRDVRRLRRARGRELAERWQRDTFDYLVNNAGFGQMAMFADTTEELYDALPPRPVQGPVLPHPALLPLLADGGAIVNTTSSSALPTGVEPGYAAYATMKGGLACSPATWRRSSARAGSASTRSPRARPGRGITDDAFERFPEVIPPLVDRTALGRLGDGDDVGKVIAALLSDDAPGSPARTSRSRAASGCSPSSQPPLSSLGKPPHSGSADLGEHADLTSPPPGRRARRDRNLRFRPHNGPAGPDALSPPARVPSSPGCWRSRRCSTCGR